MRHSYSDRDEESVRGQRSTRRSDVWGALGRPSREARVDRDEREERRAREEREPREVFEERERLRREGQEQRWDTSDERYAGTGLERNYDRGDETISSFERRFAPDVERGYGQANRFDRTYAEAYRGTYANQYGEGEGMDPEAFNQGRNSASRRFFGKGPKGYRRSDERIKEEVSELLTRSDDIDASDIEVEVKDGEVVLRGTVIERRMKRLAEDLVERVSGVRDVMNYLKLRKEGASETSAEEGRESESSVIGPKSTMVSKKSQGGAPSLNH